ncbi:MAG: hypothetical protein ABI690_36010 [Chloroflexota bacterium]
MMDGTENLQDNGTQEQEDQIDDTVLETDQNEANDDEAVEENGSSPKKRQPRRSFPSHPFEEALQLAEAIHLNAPSGVVRRLTLFGALHKSADSSTSRNWIASANKYGLIKGSFQTENLELTPEGKIAAGDEYSEYERTKAKVNLAIIHIAPFKGLYDELVNSRKFPAREFIVDIAKKYVPDVLVNEAIDIFIVNAKFVGLLQVIAGAERLVTLEHLLELVSNNVKQEVSTEDHSEDDYEVEPQITVTSLPIAVAKNPLDDVCFYITPIGEPGSDQRLHADLFLDHIIRPALAKVEGINLRVVRADTIESSGIITSQIIRHLLQSRLVIADLSFHNPNVFYELAIRHASRLPTVHIIRTTDPIPFDVNQMRTVKVDTSSIYTLIPRLDTYKSEIAVLVRRALEGDESATNPITIFYPTFKVTID